MSIRPVPVRVVSQIQSGQYVDMRDLLGDNAAVGRHMDDMRTTMGANILQISARPRVGEVSSLQSWLCCFMTFLAVGTSDRVSRERLAYAILVTGSRCVTGGMAGWNMTACSANRRHWTTPSLGISSTPGYRPPPSSRSLL